MFSIPSSKKTKPYFLLSYEDICQNVSSTCKDSCSLINYVWVIISSASFYENYEVVIPLREIIIGHCGLVVFHRMNQNRGNCPQIFDLQENWLSVWVSEGVLLVMCWAMLCMHKRWSNNASLCARVCVLVLCLHHQTPAIYPQLYSVCKQQQLQNPESPHPAHCRSCQPPYFLTCLYLPSLCVLICHRNTL